MAHRSMANHGRLEAGYRQHKHLIWLVIGSCNHSPVQVQCDVVRCEVVQLWSGVIRRRVAQTHDRKRTRLQSASESLSGSYYCLDTFDVKDHHILNISVKRNHVALLPSRHLYMATDLRPMWSRHPYSSIGARSYHVMSCHVMSCHVM
jgi:hypothetical protein